MQDQELEQAIRKESRAVAAKGGAIGAVTGGILGAIFSQAVSYYVTGHPMPVGEMLEPIAVGGGIGALALGFSALAV